jgi:hypothetical protein
MCARDCTCAVWCACDACAMVVMHLRKHAAMCGLGTAVSKVPRHCVHVRVMCVSVRVRVRVRVRLRARVTDGIESE